MTTLNLTTASVKLLIIYQQVWRWLNKNNNFKSKKINFSTDSIFFLGVLSVPP